MRVSAGIVTYKNKILLFLRDNNPAIHNPNCWSMIGGRAEGDETPVQALERELQEEISITPKNYKQILEFVGYQGEQITIFHVPLADDEASRIKLGDEGQKVEFFRFDQIESLPLTTNLKKIFTDNQELFKRLIYGGK